MEMARNKIIVEAEDGVEIPISRARKIKGKYYEVGRTCFLIKNPKGVEQYYRVETGKIGNIYGTKDWDLIERLQAKGLRECIVDKEGNISYLKMDPMVNVLIKEYFSDRDGNSRLCLNSKLATQLGYEEDAAGDFFYNKDNLSKEELRAIKKKVESSIWRKAGGNIAYNIVEDKANYKNIVAAYDNNNIEISNRTKKIAALLGNYTFGVEFETSLGNMPTREAHPMGVVALQDGSIRPGVEYTTVPMSGAKGIQNIKNICDSLSKRCEISLKCSLHIHVGNIERIPLNVLALYILIYKIQDELYEMFPYYKTDPRKIIRAEKNYCERLDDLGFIDNNIYNSDKSVNVKEIDKAFNQLYKFLSGGYSIDKADMSKVIEHPQGGRKWNRASRYRIFNFLPIIFDNSRTIEARLHTPTTNATKTLNWLFIICAIYRYVENNKYDIIANKAKITLSDVIDGYKYDFIKDKGVANELGEEVANYLNAYIKERKKFFKAKTAEGDYVCDKTEIKKDPEYTFEYKGMKGLI